MRMRSLFCGLLFLAFAQPAFSQFRLGLFGGLSNYQGDLTDKIYTSTNGAFGLTATYTLSKRLSLRAGFTLAKVSGADSLSGQDDLRARNLSFQSRITELSLVGEYNLFNLDQIRWSPYVFAGLALFHFDPYTYDAAGKKTYLHPLGTEGQGLSGYDKPYALTQLAVPVGGGLRFVLSDRIQLGLEAGLRILFTDYLDDVGGNYADPNDLLAGRGQRAVDLAYRGDEVAGGSLAFPSKGVMRGSPKSKDYYYFTGLHLSFRFGQSNNPLDCPRVNF